MAAVSARAVYSEISFQFLLPMPDIRIDCVVGARPNFIKMASVIQALSARPRFKPRLIHTGQHYSPEMSSSFFHDLEIPVPDVNLEVGAGSQIQQMAEIMCRLETLFEQDRPTLLLVVGDVTSTVASALAAVKLGIRVAHVEAGLRSFDLTMPEEINRIVTDRISHYLFASEPSGVQNLLAEGISRGSIHFSGNVMIDTLLRFREKAAGSAILDQLKLAPKGYAVVTMHRAANVDEPDRLRGFIAMLQELARSLPVVFPIHPRTQGRMANAGIGTEGLVIAPPLGYLDFLRLMMDARLMLTDSGGIQEETTILQVPCLTMRENTERPVTVTDGTNRLIGVDPTDILKAAREVLDGGWAPSGRTPELWDGRAGLRIVDALEASV
jgi:UDP-N-acetylglucosamine 2-epimerase (non-hydrolysing)